MVTAREVDLVSELLFVEPPRGVHVQLGSAVLVIRGTVFEGGNLAAEATANRIHKVAPHLAAAVSQPVRERCAFGVQKNSGGFAATGREHNHTSPGLQ